MTEVAIDKTFDVITLGESMALFVADQAGPLADGEHFTK